MLVLTVADPLQSNLPSQSDATINRPSGVAYITPCKNSFIAIASKWCRANIGQCLVKLLFLAHADPGLVPILDGQQVFQNFRFVILCIQSLN